MFSYAPHSYGNIAANFGFIDHNRTHFAGCENLAFFGHDDGTQEFTAPKRVVTSLVRLTSGGVVSVKTDGLVLKTLIPEVLSEIGKLRLSAPLKIGDVAKENVAGSGVNLVVTEDIK